MLTLPEISVHDCHTAKSHYSSNLGPVANYRGVLWVRRAIRCGPGGAHSRTQAGQANEQRLALSGAECRSSRRRYGCCWFNGLVLLSSESVSAVKGPDAVPKLSSRVTTTSRVTSEPSCFVQVSKAA